MLIAPDTDLDRSWFPSERSAVQYVDEVQANVRLGTLRRYYHPSWRVLLKFFVDAELPDIPVGYVMPGWVHGERLESSPL